MSAARGRRKAAAEAKGSAHDDGAVGRDAVLGDNLGRMASVGLVTVVVELENETRNALSLSAKAGNSSKQAQRKR